MVGADAMALLETTGAIAQRSIAKLSRAIVTSKSLIELRLIDVNINEVLQKKKKKRIAPSFSLRVACVYLSGACDCTEQDHQVL